MRVLFYTYPTAFQNPGGGETVLLNSKKYLEQLGCRVDLFNLWETKISDYDIVHCFASSTYPFWFDVKNYKRKLIVTPTLYPYTNIRTILKSVTKHYLKKYIFRKHYIWSSERAFHLVDKFTVPSNAEADSLRKNFLLPANRFEIVPNGVDIRFFEKVDDRFRKQYNLEEYILTVGRINPNKNQLSLIRACKKIGIPLVIIGEPDPDSIEYFNKCKEEGKGNTIFTGYINHDDPLLHSAYQHCSVFVLPSYRETCGMVALEAGLAGAKVVISELKTTKEYFKNYVEYVSPADIDSILKSIEKTLKKSWDNVLQTYILQNFTWDKIAMKLLNVYIALMS